MKFATLTAVLSLAFATSQALADAPRWTPVCISLPNATPHRVIRIESYGVEAQYAHPVEAGLHDRYRVAIYSYSSRNGALVKTDVREASGSLVPQTGALSLQFLDRDGGSLSGVLNAPGFTSSYDPTAYMHDTAEAMRCFWAQTK